MDGPKGNLSVIPAALSRSRGAVTRRAVAQRRSRASGLTRPLAGGYPGVWVGFCCRPVSPVPPRFSVSLYFQFFTVIDSLPATRPPKRLIRRPRPRLAGVFHPLPATSWCGSSSLPLLRGLRVVPGAAFPGLVAGQAAQRHQPHHEAKIGVRFAGRDKLVHLIGLGEVVPGRDKLVHLIGLGEVVPAPGAWAGGISSSTQTGR